MYDRAIYNISGGEPCYRVYTQVPDSDFYQKAGKLFLFCVFPAPIALSRSRTIVYWTTACPP